MDVVKNEKTGMYVRVSDVGNKQEDTSSAVPQEAPKQEEKKANKDRVVDLDALRKRIEENKKKKEGVSKPTETNVSEQETKQEPTDVEQGAIADHGFDYSEVGDKVTSPKNTQKLVIINLAKMQRLSVEDYIKKTLGASKSVDDLTAEEAGHVVRSGLSTTFE